MISAEFSVAAESANGRPQEELAELALRPVKRRSLRYEIEPSGTTIIRGDLDDVFAAVQEAHELLVAAGADRLVTTVCVEDRRGTSPGDRLTGFWEPDLEPHEALEMGS